MGWNDKIVQQHVPVTGIEENKVKYCNLLKDSKEFRILDIGFGTGVNTLLAINHIKENFPGRKIVIYGIDTDKYLLDYAKELNKHKIHTDQEKILDSLSKRRVYESNEVKIRLIDGSIHEKITELPEGFNYVFCDLFHEGPWNTGFFRNMKKKLQPGAILGFPTNNHELYLALERAGYSIISGQTIPFSMMKAKNL